MSGEIMKRRKEIYDLLESKETVNAVEEMLPEKYKPHAKRFIRRARLTIANSKSREKLEACQPTSFVRAICSAAAYGFALDDRMCYAIPWGGKVDATFDWKALVAVARRHRLITDLRVQDIRANDEWEMRDEDFQQRYRFVKCEHDDRGEIIGAYAVVSFPDGTHRLEHMAMEELQKVRKASKSPDSPAWKNWEHRMYCKAVAKRALSSVQDDPTLGEMIEYDNREFEEVETRTVEVNDLKDLAYKSAKGSGDTEDAMSEGSKCVMNFLSRISKCSEEDSDGLLADIEQSELLNDLQKEGVLRKFHEKFQESSEVS